MPRDTQRGYAGDIPVACYSARITFGRRLEVKSGGRDAIQYTDSNELWDECIS